MDWTRTNRKMLLMLENEGRWRGKCYDLSGLPHLGVCLYSDSDYFVHVDAMTKGIHFITDDEEIFREQTKDNWAGQKGLLFHLNCWDVCEELITNSTGSCSDFVEIEYHHKPEACHYAIKNAITRLKSVCKQQ